MIYILSSYPPSFFIFSHFKSLKGYLEQFFVRSLGFLAVDSIVPSASKEHRRVASLPFLWNNDRPTNQQTDGQRVHREV